MSTLVIAIETIGYEWDTLSPATKNSLTKHLQRTDLNDIEIGRRYQLIKDKLGLSPFTGEIISLAMYDIERELGVVYFVSDEAKGKFSDDSFTYKAATEKEMLEDFWEGADAYDVFVTFNGRAFTLPFLYHRSAIHKVKPKVEIARQRYVTNQNLPYHVDLLDEYTFNGAMHPRPALGVIAGAYGIPYVEVCTGDEVAEFFQQKKFSHLTTRNTNQVLVMIELYKIWQKNFAPLSFINALEM